MDNGKWHVDEKIKFINPYNFVPLEGNCKRDEAEKGKLLGVIECSLIPKTDIFIPNTSNEFAFGNFKVENHKSYEFFSYKDLTGMNCTNSKGPENPVITGSEIRGVIRNAYETVTNSCLSTLNTKKVLSTRSVNAKNAGVIFKENGHWILKKATRYMLKTSNCLADDGEKYEKKFENDEVYIEACGKKYKTGDSISFISSEKHYKEKNFMPITVSKICESSKKGSKEGYLLLGEKFGKRKHHDSIFVLTKDCKPKNVDEAIKKLEISLNEFYKNEGVNKDYKKGHNGYPDMKIKEDTPIPIWYEEIGENIYLSPACVGRNIYYSTLKSLTKTYSPCTSKSNLCSGCNVFGMVSEDNDKEAKATKVRFTDAKLSGNSKVEYTNITTIKELASPKISSVEFYTDVHENYRNSYSYWNYDYYVIYGKPNKYRLLRNSLDLRGRKFYWHHKGNYTEKKVTERNITIRALKANDNTIFNFKVYFEKLTEEELKRLLFTLSIGANDGNGCYKIGTGKPLGLGSVKIKVDNVKLRKLNIENGKILYKIEDTKEFEEYYLNVTREYYEKDNKELEIENICEKMDFNKDTIKAFMKLTDFNAIAQNKTVSYPIGENERNSEEMKNSTANWFIGNRATKTSATSPKFNEILPKATDENLELSKMIYE